MGDKIIVEMDSGEILEIKAMREVGVGHMIGNLKIITEGTIKASVTVGQGQVLEQVPIGTGLDVSSVKSTIILQETAQQHKQIERVEQIQQMFNMDGEQTLLQMPLIDTDQVRQSINTTDARENINLQRVRMVSQHFCLYVQN